MDGDRVKTCYDCKNRILNTWLWNYIGCKISDTITHKDDAERIDVSKCPYFEERR